MVRTVSTLGVLRPDQTKKYSQCAQHLGKFYGQWGISGPSSAIIHFYQQNIHLSRTRRTRNMFLLCHRRSRSRAFSRHVSSSRHHIAWYVAHVRHVPSSKGLLPKVFHKLLVSVFNTFIDCLFELISGLWWELCHTNAVVRRRGVSGSVGLAQASIRGWCP